MFATLRVKVQDAAAPNFFTWALCGRSIDPISNLVIGSLLLPGPIHCNRRHPPPPGCRRFLLQGCAPKSLPEPSRAAQFENVGSSSTGLARQPRPPGQDRGWRPAWPAWPAFEVCSIAILPGREDQIRQSGNLPHFQMFINLGRGDTHPAVPGPGTAADTRSRNWRPGIRDGAVGLHAPLRPRCLRHRRLCATGRSPSGAQYARCPSWMPA